MDSTGVWSSIGQRVNEFKLEGAIIRYELLEDYVLIRACLHNMLLFMSHLIFSDVNVVLRLQHPKRYRFWTVRIATPICMGVLYRPTLASNATILSDCHFSPQQSQRAFVLLDPKHWQQLEGHHFGSPDPNNSRRLSTPGERNMIHQRQFVVALWRPLIEPCTYTVSTS